MPFVEGTVKDSVRDVVGTGTDRREPNEPGTEGEIPQEEKPVLVPDQLAPKVPMAHVPEAPPEQAPNAPEPNLPPQEGAPMLAQATPAENPPVRTLGQALTGAMREDVLGQPRQEQRPLDGDDAVAAVDAGLKAVAGERAGLSVQRDTEGRRKRFDLRLGRNLAISASR